MSDEVKYTPIAEQEVSAQPKPAPAEQEVKGFSRADIVPVIVARITFPAIFPDLVFTFKMRMKLSVKGEEERQLWLNYAQAKRTEMQPIQGLKETCDLLTEKPEGFSDLQYNGKSWGSSFYDYVNLCPNNETKEFLLLVAEGANSYYWNAIAPQEFRPKVQANRS